MTLSPKTLTSIAPLARSTSRVRISRMAFERAFTSIAHTPRMIGGLTGSVAVERSEWEPFGEGVVDLFVSRERDLGEDGEGS